MNYYQYYYFTEKELENVNNNLIIICNKIKELDNKLNDKSKSLSEIEINRITKSIDRLNMSKKCIKYYYNI
tara:strand:- start:639 stop:851 length:213 start_codon:yes stop_codon:yes gene_type:complete